MTGILIASSLILSCLETLGIKGAEVGPEPGRGDRPDPRNGLEGLDPRRPPDRGEGLCKGFKSRLLNTLVSLAARSSCVDFNVFLRVLSA